MMHFISHERKQKYTCCSELYNLIYLCFCDYVPCLLSGPGYIIENSRKQSVKPDCLGMCTCTCIHTQACLNTGKANHHSGSILPFPDQVKHSNVEVFVFPGDMEEMDRVTQKLF